MSTKLFDQAAAAIERATKDRGAGDTVTMNVGDLSVILGLLRSLSSQSLSLSEAIERGDRYKRIADDHRSLIAELKPALSEAREALEPFARIAAEYADQEDDDFQVWRDFDVLGATLPLRIFRRARKVLENGPAGLADATNDPTDPDLSSLRKGAEVVAWRIRPIADHVWHLTDDPRPRLGYEMQPLYALVSGSREDNP